MYRRNKGFNKQARSQKGTNFHLPFWAFSLLPFVDLVEAAL
jgi:hypothetical protein